MSTSHEHAGPSERGARARAQDGAWLPAAVKLFVLGATLGTALDGLHTATGTTTYVAPTLAAGDWSIAWWTPLLFGAAAIALGMGRPLVAATLGRIEEPPRPDQALEGLAAFVIAFILSATVPAGGAVRAVVLGLLLLTAIALLDRSLLAVVLAVVAAAVGAAAEIALIRAGAFRHLRPDVVDLPYWLPLLYAVGSVGIGTLARRLVHAGRIA